MHTTPRLDSLSAPGATPAAAFALALVVWLAAACAPEETAPPEPGPRQIKIFTVGGDDGEQVREYPGTVAPKEEVDLAFDASGRITELKVTEGQVVRKGQLIARLDARNQEARLRSQKASLEAARADFERFRSLVERKAASQQQFELARRNLEVAESQVEVASKALEETELQAPFSGRIAKRLVDGFQAVQAKQPIVVLHDDSSLEIIINVPEGDIALGDPRLSVPRQTERFRPTVEISTFPGRELQARISEYATTADPITRTFEVRFSFRRPNDLQILPGMTARITIRLDDSSEQGPLRIPARAVIADDGGEAFVWKVDASLTVARSAVAVGELTGSDVEVLSGLNAGDRVAVSGVHHLREGMQVREL